MLYGAIDSLISIVTSVLAFQPLPILVYSTICYHIFRQQDILPAP
nr:MAG TPA: hypothetical protein [Bacteriophage sp.]